MRARKLAAAAVTFAAALNMGCSVYGPPKDEGEMPAYSAQTEETLMSIDETADTSETTDTEETNNGEINDG